MNQSWLRFASLDTSSTIQVIDMDIDGEEFMGTSFPRASDRMAFLSIQCTVLTSLCLQKMIAGFSTLSVLQNLFMVGILAIRFTLESTLVELTMASEWFCIQYNQFQDRLIGGLFTQCVQVDLVRYAFQLVVHSVEALVDQGDQGWWQCCVPKHVHVLSSPVHACI